MPLGMAWTRSRGMPHREIRRDCMAVGDPGSRIARDGAGEERAEQPLALNDREVEVRFAAPPRLDDDRLAEPLSCDHRRERVQAAMNDVNHVVATSVSPQPGGDAAAPRTGRRRSAVRPDSGPREAGSAVRQQAPPSPAPGFCARGVAQAASRAAPRRASALRQSPGLLLGATEGLREISRQDHDDARSRRPGVGTNVRRHGEESASATCCRHATAPYPWSMSARARRPRRSRKEGSSIRRRIAARAPWASGAGSFTMFSPSRP